VTPSKNLAPVKTGTVDEPTKPKTPKTTTAQPPGTFISVRKYSPLSGATEMIYC
jgi:hypothetical protein